MKKNTMHFSQNTSYKNTSKNSEVLMSKPSIRSSNTWKNPGGDWHPGNPWNLAGLRDWAKSFCVVAVHPRQKMAASQHLSTSHVDTSEIIGMWINYIQKSSNPT